MRISTENLWLWNNIDFHYCQRRNFSPSKRKGMRHSGGIGFSFYRSVKELRKSPVKRRKPRYPWTLIWWSNVYKFPRNLVTQDYDTQPKCWSTRTTTDTTFSRTDEFKNEQQTHLRKTITQWQDPTRPEGSQNERLMDGMVTVKKSGWALKNQNQTEVDILVTGWKMDFTLFATGCRSGCGNTAFLGMGLHFRNDQPLYIFCCFFFS